MDQAALVESKIEAGTALLSALDALGFPIKSAFWNYSDETGWRLVIASQLVRERGVREAYQRVNQALFGLRGIDLALSDVSLVPDTEPLVALLARAISTGPSDLSRIRFTGNAINGVFIEDALIYRST